MHKFKPTMYRKNIFEIDYKKLKELAPPPPPSIPSKATSEEKQAAMASYNAAVKKVSTQNTAIREQNRKIDNYVSSCNTAKSKLKAIIAKMRSVEASFKSETTYYESQADPLCEAAVAAVKQSSTINAAMNSYYSAFDQVYQAAQRIEMLTPSSIKERFDIRQIKIRNTHTHSSAPSVFEYGFSSQQGSVSSKSYVIINAPTDEVLIKSKDEASFFESLKNANRIKMPSANLRKLGGQAFIAKMNELGYTVIIQENGTIIDMDGRIHWEKKN